MNEKLINWFTVLDLRLPSYLRRVWMLSKN